MRLCGARKYIVLDRPPLKAQRSIVSGGGVPFPFESLNLDT